MPNIYRNFMMSHPLLLHAVKLGIDIHKLIIVSFIFYDLL